MQYGVCVNMLLKEGEGPGMELASSLKTIGFDYIELPLNRICQLEKAEFERQAEELERTALPCRCCNDFMPASFQIVGDDLTPQAVLREYLANALERLTRLGARFTVFGSPWSRGCPDGFSRERAWVQIADFLRMVGEMAAPYGVIVAVEHNNHSETNTMNHFSDVVKMVRTVNHPNVRALCDYYHLRFEGDSPDILQDGGNLLVHTHIAQLKDRGFLTDLNEEPTLRAYAETLHRIGYEGGVSVEARPTHSESWEAEAALTLSNLRQVFKS